MYFDVAIGLTPGVEDECRRGQLDSLPREAASSLES
jgi:hypothetical protein